MIYFIFNNSNKWSNAILFCFGKSALKKKNRRILSHLSHVLSAYHCHCYLFRHTVRNWSRSSEQMILKYIFVKEILWMRGATIAHVYMHACVPCFVLSRVVFLVKSLLKCLLGIILWILETQRWKNKLSAGCISTTFVWPGVWLYSTLWDLSVLAYTVSTGVCWPQRVVRIMWDDE